jgi:serine protease inhibitor
MGKMLANRFFGGVLAIIAALSLPATKGEARPGNEVSSFSTDFFRLIAKDKRQQNFVLSGESLEVVLQMLQQGSSGLTQRELSQALCGQSQPCSIAAGNKLGYQAANAVWVQQGLVIKSGYQTDLKSQFHSEILSANFQKDPSAAVKQVNSWAKKNTAGMITEILQLSDIDTNTAMILANAIYFQRFWPTAFDPKNTTNVEFQLLNGKKTSVPTMSKKDHYFSATQNGVRMIGLPYRNSSLEMLVLMPEEAKKFPQFVSSITSQTINSLLAAQHDIELTLFMPKFSITSFFSDLKSTLQSMGIRKVFTQSAELDKISTNPPLSLSKVLQKAVIIVDEKGTKAAAVTAGIVVMRAVMPMMFRVDRPFVFAIVDQKTHKIIFMGQVVNPAL